MSKHTLTIRRELPKITVGLRGVLNRFRFNVAGRLFHQKLSELARIHHLPEREEIERVKEILEEE